MLGTDPDRSLCGEGTQTIYGDVVEQTKRGANGKSYSTMARRTSPRRAGLSSNCGPSPSRTKRAMTMTMRMKTQASRRRARTTTRTRKTRRRRRRPRTRLRLQQMPKPARRLRVQTRSSRRELSGAKLRAGTVAHWATIEQAAKNSRRREGRVPRLRKRSGRPPLSYLKAVQVRFAAIGCLRARTVRLRELLH